MTAAPTSTHFLTGATGTVGGALLRALLDDGQRVLAMVRRADEGPALARAGAEVVVGDLTVPGPWRDRLDEADRVWHLGLPRLAPPVRGRGARRAAEVARQGATHLAAAAGDRPVVMASTVLVYGSHDGEVRDDAPAAPGALARAAHAAESALAGPAFTAVRLGWVYGPGGMVGAMVRGLGHSRYRIVGTGDTRLPLISPVDAAGALMAAARLAPGVYAAAESDVPTHQELVNTVCAATGARRPDHLPPRLAALTFGGALVEALLSSSLPACDGLVAAGWRPRCRWRQDLVDVSREAAGSG